MCFSVSAPTSAQPRARIDDIIAQLNSEDKVEHIAARRAATGTRLVRRLGLRAEIKARETRSGAAQTNMKFNDTAAAYGLFQVVFADLTDHLAVATFRLREQREPGLTFEAVFRQELTKILRQFRDELKQFDDRSVVADNVRELRDACVIISTLSSWRNDRVHARVRLAEQGYALFDWRTGRRLDITRAQIETNIEMAIKAIVALEANVQHLVHQLKWDEEFEKLFRTLPELAEPPVSDSDASRE